MITQTQKQMTQMKALGQASLEMTAALILVMVLLVAALKLFVWVNSRMIYRQQGYEVTRRAAGSVHPGPVDLLDIQETEWNEPTTTLDIIGEFD